MPLSLSKLLWVAMMETALIEKHSCTSTTEEHLEYIVRVKLILSKLLLVSLSEVIFSAMLIIDLLLFRVA